MKKKIIFAIATGFFAMATVINISILNSNGSGDISLDAISVMAQAQREISHTSTYPCVDESDYSATKTYGFGGYRFGARICSAHRCGFNYHKNTWANADGSCTVYYY